ncbi:MAG: 4-hydroxythreonine-4-phosphate dehydrogenase PdxA [Desulfobacteraceae bacterium]|nr:4-hydroxythreonine-4-phosphate dehydrogenase PdxA [Desulfobacteraceae bacterium]
MDSFLPRVAVTMGDPCGVGPEIIVKAFSSRLFAADCFAFVIGDTLAVERAADLLGSRTAVRQVLSAEEAIAGHRPGTIPVLSAGRLESGDLAWANPSPAACGLTVSCIETAVGLALSGTIDAIATCPVNKEKLHGNGFPFPGHTEFIRDLTRSDEVIMMLAGPKLRVSLVTIHEALADVPRLLTADRLRATIRITAEAMCRDFGFDSPRIAVAGLNPHAGEAGRFGREEIDLIRPVVEEIRSRGRAISGPWPPDTIFHRALSGEFDAVVAMYHDQGLIPVKLAHFSDAVNVSLGLPIVRTSVDHGTAYDIAGTGKAAPDSLIAAVALASAIARNRRKSAVQR